MCLGDINVNVNWGRSGDGCRDCDRSCGSGCVYVCVYEQLCGSNDDIFGSKHFI